MDDATPKAEDKPQVDELFTVESAIKEHMSQIEKLGDELKPVKEMLDDYLDNDPTYRERTELAKKASQLKSQTKQQLLKQPNAVQLVEKIKTMKEEMKGLNEALSYYLREFQRLTGANEFEGSDGELRQIVYIAKLVRKTNLNK